MSDDRVARVRALGKEHARVETEGDLPATMATLVANPVYEFLPVGGLLEGRDEVEQYYQHLIASFLPRVEEARLIDDWCNERSLVEEYEMDVQVDGTVEQHRVTGITQDVRAGAADARCKVPGQRERAGSNKPLSHPALSAKHHTNQ